MSFSADALAADFDDDDDEEEEGEGGKGKGKVTKGGEEKGRGPWVNSDAVDWGAVA